MLYTISKIAKILKIPESTARYYRDRYPEFILSTGAGRKKRYKKETLKVLRIICEMANNSKTAEEIKERLSQEFSRNIEVIEETRIITAVEQQQHFLEVISNSLENMADQKKAIQELREEVNDLKKYIDKNWRRLSWLQRLFKKLKND
ncbi:MerR family transcriptional regulator [Candidatus Atribacteria bacterium 1244-E10-H5-B2]|nr:MAG: MerR family transcriptional regulator [Candidatus Atribacteria bacterium 1244-E10-H5-B2]